MSRQRLYIVHGMGADAVGLVGNITTPIARAGGNIVDLRQDVLHGLFTIYMVVDLGASDLRIDAFKDMVKAISEDTAVALTVDTYHPVARNPEKKNMLLILVGSDRPGIIASISQTLGKYSTNIEFAKNIAREGVFLMELLTDISNSSLPLDNLKAEIEQAMAGVGIRAIFQTEDVFNKQKRVILFDIASSLIPASTIAEIVRQTGLSNSDLAPVYRCSAAASLSAAASCLEALPADVISTIAQGLSPSPGTTELMQTLKIMGYKIVLATTGFAPFTDVLGEKLGIDHCFGMPLVIDDDSRSVAGDIASGDYAMRDLDAVIGAVTQKESIGRGDVTVLSDRDGEQTPGIRVELDLEKLLELFNSRVIDRRKLVGVLGAFGTPRIQGRQ